MLTAQTFLKQLQEGNFNEAIKTIKESLKDRSVSMINEQRAVVLESYGFKITEKEEESDDSEDEEEEEADKDSEDKEG